MWPKNCYDNFVNYKWKEIYFSIGLELLSFVRCFVEILQKSDIRFRIRTNNFLLVCMHHDQWSLEEFNFMSTISKIGFQTLKMWTHYLKSMRDARSHEYSWYVFCDKCEGSIPWFIIIFTFLLINRLWSHLTEVQS